MGQQRDSTAGVGVLGGVGQQVADHLRQAQRIDVEHQCALRDIDRQPVPLGVDVRPRGFDRVVDNARQRHRGLAQQQSPAGNARHIQQVIQQQRHALHLALDHVMAPLLLSVGGRGRARDARCLADRRQRISKFMCQRRQEFVLAPIRFLQLQLLRLELGDVGEPHRRRAVQRRCNHMKPCALAVRRAHFEFVLLAAIDHADVPVEQPGRLPVARQHIEHAAAGEILDPQPKSARGSGIRIVPAQVYAAALRISHRRQDVERHRRGFQCDGESLLIARGR